MDIHPSHYDWLSIKLALNMYKGHPFASKVLQKMEQEKQQQQHRNNLKSIRPRTGLGESNDNCLTLNTRKKEMQNENKFTQIQRENRLLLNKITHIMSKKRCTSEMKGSGSLNSTLRRRQFQSIEIENAKMLKRLQERKSDYELHKFKKEWKKTKTVIKNITSYPLVDEITGRKRKKNNYTDILELKKIAITDPEDFSLVKIKLIDSKKFIVTLKFTPTKFVVIGDMRTQQELKVIEIEKSEALQFIEEHCQGNIHKIFDLLRFNEAQDSLYLISEEQKKEELAEKGSIRRKRQNSHKPVLEQGNYLTLNREDLVF